MKVLARALRVRIMEQHIVAPLIWVFFFFYLRISIQLAELPTPCFHFGGPLITAKA